MYAGLGPPDPGSSRGEVNDEAIALHRRGARHRAALERLGVSYSDSVDIDTDTVLGDRTVGALIRSMGAIAEFAPVYCAELVELNAALIAEIEAIRSERRSQ